MTAMTREEWERRYAARVMEVADMPEQQAMEIARIGSEVYEEQEGGAVNWAEAECPEDMADDEMSYWENDE